MLIQKKTLKNVLFIDIETVSQSQNFHELSETKQKLWTRKSKQFLVDKSLEIDKELAAELYEEKAGLFAEFGKVACVSIGYLSKEKRKDYTLRIKSFTGSEEEILKSLNDVLNEHYNDLDKHFLCGHNIREFDIPFLCRRNIVHGLKLPEMFKISSRKPWQITHLIDTMHLWKFGDYKNYTSLNLLANTLDIPTLEPEIAGSEISRIFWEEEDISKIVIRCEKDVLTVTQITLRFTGQSILDINQVELVNN